MMLSFPLEVDILDVIRGCFLVEIRMEGLCEDICYVRRRGNRP